jgi:hypothetical protein
VESQLLRRKEIMRISILQQSTNYQSGIPEYSVWLNQSTGFLEQSLQWELKEISFVNYMSGDGESGKPTLPWDPGEQQNVVIFAKLKVGSRSAKGTRKCMLLNLPKLMQSLLLPHGNSLSQPNGKVKEAKIARTEYIVPTTGSEELWEGFDIVMNYNSEALNSLKISTDETDRQQFGYPTVRISQYPFAL